MEVNNVISLNLFYVWKDSICRPAEISMWTYFSFIKFPLETTQHIKLKKELRKTQTFLPLQGLV